MGEAPVRGQEGGAKGVVIGRGGFQAALRCFGEFSVNGIELGLHLAERNKSQDRLSILVWTERRVRPELVRGLE
jgi:hypothetical protein